MRIDVVKPSELSSADQQAWRALQAGRFAIASPFLSPGWARTIERAGAPGEVRVAVLRDDGGLAKGFFAGRCGPVTALPAGAPMNDHQALVAAPGVEVSAVDLLGALGVQRYDFSHLAAADPAFGAYAQGVQDSYVVDLSDGWDAFEAGRRAAGTEILKDMARKRRKIEREVGPVTFTAMSRSQAEFDRLMDWKRAHFRRTRQTDILAWRWVRNALEELFHSHDPEFGGMLSVLHVGDRMAAAQFNLRGPDEIHSWLIGHDDAIERYSPGLVMFNDLLRWMAGSPYKRLELGPIPYRFKDRLANRTRSIAYGYAGLPSTATLVRAAEYKLRNVAESLPLGRASHWPGKAMRRLDLWRGLG